MPQHQDLRSNFKGKNDAPCNSSTNFYRASIESPIVDAYSHVLSFFFTRKTGDDNGLEGEGEGSHGAGSNF